MDLSNNFLQSTHYYNSTDQTLYVSKKLVKNMGCIIIIYCVYIILLDQDIDQIFYYNIYTVYI